MGRSSVGVPIEAYSQHLIRLKGVEFACSSRAPRGFVYRSPFHKGMQNHLYYTASLWSERAPDGTGVELGRIM